TADQATTEVFNPATRNYRAVSGVRVIDQRHDLHELDARRGAIDFSEARHHLISKIRTRGLIGIPHIEVLCLALRGVYRKRLRTQPGHILEQRPRSLRNLEQRLLIEIIHVCEGDKYTNHGYLPELPMTDARSERLGNPIGGDDDKQRHKRCGDNTYAELPICSICICFRLGRRGATLYSLATSLTYSTGVLWTASKNYWLWKRSGKPRPAIFMVSTSATGVCSPAPLPAMSR